MMKALTYTGLILATIATQGYAEGFSFDALNRTIDNFQGKVDTYQGKAQEQVNKAQRAQETVQNPPSAGQMAENEVRHQSSSYLRQLEGFIGNMADQQESKQQGTAPSTMRSNLFGLQ